MPVSTTDLTARIRERAAELDAGGSGHWPACYGGYPCNCASQPGALVRVVEDVLELHAPERDYPGDEYADIVCAECRTAVTPFASRVPYPCDTVEAIASALGVPTESDPCREHQGGGQ